MAETYRRTPPVYKAVQLSKETVEDAIALIRDFGYGSPSEDWWRNEVSIQITGDKFERAAYKDYRFAPLISKPEFPINLTADTWIVTSREGIELHSPASFAAYFEKD